MSLQKSEDRELVRKYLEGNEVAFEVLLNRHKNKIFAYIIMMVKDQDIANDVFQDTFMKVVRTLKRGKYNEEGKFLPWVMRIAHNLMIDHFRKKKKMPTIGESAGSGEDEFNIFDTIPREDPTVEDTMIGKQINKDVRKLIDRLPKDQREVVIMRHYCEMSFKEIAHLTNVSINTALGRMRYALINMRKMMEEHNMVMTRY